MIGATSRAAPDDGPEESRQPGARAGGVSFGDEIVFNLDLDEHADDEEGDELDVAFPGGFAFVRDRYASLVSSNGQGATPASDTQAGAGLEGMGGARGLVGVGEAGAQQVPAADTAAVSPGGAEGQKPLAVGGGPDSVDAGWLYSR